MRFGPPIDLPDSPPLTEKDNVFNTPAYGTNEKDLEVEHVKSLDAEHHDDFTIDPFKPFDDLPSERKNILTIRALFVGLCCGALVNASNVYLGLKTGWTFTANLFGVSTASQIQTHRTTSGCSCSWPGHCRFRRRQVHIQGSPRDLPPPWWRLRTP